MPFIRAGDVGPEGAWMQRSPPIDFGIVPVSPGFSAMAFSMPGLVPIRDMLYASPIDSSPGFAAFFGAILPIQLGIIFAPGVAAVGFYNTTAAPVDTTGETVTYEAIGFHPYNLRQGP